MALNATTEAFENVKTQVGCCGIWCGSCVVGNGTLRELTGRFERLLESYGVLEWGAGNFDSAGFLKGLKSVQAIPVCAGCLKGGGRDKCDLRACAKGKAINDCGKCATFSACAHADLLEHMRSGALAAGLVVKPSNDNMRETIDVWTADLRNRFPSSLLFQEEHETTQGEVSTQT